MSNHSIIEHRANYHYIKMEEDYVQICSQGKEYPHCKAFILSILEHWMNDKKDKGQDAFVYMSYPQWILSMYGMFRRNHVINALAELEKEQLIIRRPCRYQGKDTFEYALNVPEVQRRIKALEEKIEKCTRPNINPFKFKRVEKQTGLNLNGTTDLNLNDDPFKNKHTIDTTEIPSDIDSRGTSVAANADNTSPAHSFSEENEDDRSQDDIPTETRIPAKKIIKPVITLPSKQPTTPPTPAQESPPARIAAVLEQAAFGQTEPLPILVLHKQANSEGETLDIHQPRRLPGTSDTVHRNANHELSDRSSNPTHHGSPRPVAELETPQEVAKTVPKRTPAKAKAAVIEIEPETQAVLDAWCSIFKARPKIGEKSIEAAAYLVEPCRIWCAELDLSVKEFLNKIREWAYSQDKKGYYGRGVKITDIPHEFEGWQSAQERAAPGVGNGRPKEPVSIYADIDALMRRGQSHTVGRA